MSYGLASKKSLLFPMFALLAACSGNAQEAADDTSAAATAKSKTTAGAASDATLSFHADFTSTASGPLVAGQKLTIAYDTARNTQCRGDQNGHPGWSVTGYARINGGAVTSFEAGGFSPSGGHDLPIIDLGATGDLEIWFEVTSVWGCHAYDSNYGANYHFHIDPSPKAPGWMGNQASIVSRATCNGGPCDADRHPLDQGFSFDTWARQRAAITQATFDVWKGGVTDWDNPDLWKALDVEVFYRVGGTGPFSMKYVSFDRRVDHNARYSFSLRDLDPLNGVNGNALTDRSQCPTFALGTDPSGQYVQVDLQFHMSVNGVELRPAGGGEFKGTYQNYKGMYAVCF